MSDIAARRGRASSGRLTYAAFARVMVSGPRAQALSAICGLLAGPVFISGWVAGGLAQPDEYSFLFDAPSDLDADTADSPWIQNRLGDNLTGLLIVVFAIGLSRSLGLHPSARIGSALLAVVGVGLFLAGIFRLDCREIDAGCAAPDASWHGTTHGIVAGITLLAVVVAPFVLARALKVDPRWRDLRVPTLLFGTAAIAATIAGPFLGQGLGGQLNTIVWFSCFGVLALRMLRLAQEEALRVSPVGRRRAA